MSINQPAFLELIDRYMAGTATDSERALVEETFLKMSQEKEDLHLSPELEEALKTALFERTLQHIATRPEVHLPGRKPKFYYLRIFRMAAAALLLFALGAAGWFYLGKQKVSIVAVKSPVRKTEADIAPGKEGALLTLADGTTIVLDSAGAGLLSRQRGAEVIKTNGGLTYHQAQLAAGEMVYNTMTTPKGRQYNITLSDGSKVWLNAGSSITFPTAFSGKERRISITGEVYFEVSKNKRMPFTVSMANGEEVQVLGTHFNVNAYDNEPVTQTTLLEGSVKINSGRESVVIKPGQQAVSPRNKTDIKISQVDTDEVMAWKEGFFQFDHADLRYLLRQLARWYDLDIVFEGNRDNRMLGGRINRNLNLSAVLKALEAKDIRYRLEGKKLIVL